MFYSVPLSFIKTVVFVTAIIGCPFLTCPVLAFDDPGGEINITVSDNKEFTFYHYPAKIQIKKIML